MTHPRTHDSLVQVPTPRATVLPGAVRQVLDRMAETSGVEAVLLGGSRATGTATADSDWDLGVYYRGSLDLAPLAELGHVHPPGSWGRLMNGGAWLDLAGTRVDVIFRDLDVVEHWTDEAHAGRFDVDGLLGYLAGFPTYTLSAEVGSSTPLYDQLALDTSFPDQLRRTAPPRWRFHRDFSLHHARRAAALGNEIVALGQLSRAMVEEAHARHCAAGRWVLNEKRIQDGTGLGLGLPAPPGPVGEAIEELARQLIEQDDVSASGGPR